MRRRGAVIVFREGITPQEAAKILRALEDDGKIEPQTRLEAFNPNDGHPVWYVP